MNKLAAGFAVLASIAAFAKAWLVRGLERIMSSFVAVFATLSLGGALIGDPFAEDTGWRVTVIKGDTQ